jgi:hypothetical protein
LGGAFLRAFRTVLAIVLAAALVLPPAALAQGTNPLAPGFPQPSVSTPATTPATPTITTTTTAGSGSGFNGSSVVIIAIGALVVLGGISLYIWRDARRRAPVKHRAAATGALGEGRRSGSKQKTKPRKLSPEERRRRKRGRAR